MKRKEFRKGLLMRAIPAAIFLVATAVSAALDAPLWLIFVLLGLMIGTAIWGLYFITSNFQRHLSTFRREDLAKAVFDENAPEIDKEEFFNKSYYNTFNNDTVRFVETGIIINAESDTPIKFSWAELKSAEIDQIKNTVNLPQIKFVFASGDTHYIYFDMETYLFLQQMTGNAIRNFAELKDALAEFNS